MPWVRSCAGPILQTSNPSPCQLRAMCEHMLHEQAWIIILHVEAARLVSIREHLGNRHNRKVRMVIIGACNLVGRNLLHLVNVGLDLFQQ